MKQTFFFFFISLVFLSTACAGHICKNQEQAVVFSFDPLFQTVDVGGHPTYKASDSWVEKMFVSSNAFLILSKQKHGAFRKTDCKPTTVYCVDEGKDPSVANNNKACDKNKKQICTEFYYKFSYDLQSYTKKEGYQYWEDLPEKELMSISNIDSRPSLKANFQARRCRFLPFAGLLNFFLAWIKAQ